MPTWTSITVGKFCLYDTKNDYYKWYFLDEDRVREVSQNDEAGQFYNSFVGYRTTVAQMRRRLSNDELHRASLEIDFRKSLNDWKSKYLQELKDIENGTLLGTELGAWIKKEWIKQVLPVLENAVLDDWLSRLRKAVDWPDVPKNNFLLYTWSEADDPILSLMLSTTDPDVDVTSHSHFNFPCSDPKFYALGVLLASDDDAFCELNLNGLITDGKIEDFIDLEKQAVGATLHLRHARRSLADLHNLIESEPLNLALMRMCYSGIITIMEAYLSDIFITSVKHLPVRRRFVEKYEKFQSGKKEPLSEVFKLLDRLDQVIEEELFKLSFHHVPTVTKLYKECLHIEFPEDLKEQIGKAVSLRHDIVHRNGRNTQGQSHAIMLKDVKELDLLISDFISYIDTRILDAFSRKFILDE
ncbi:HEPN/Toprim-associated domain-containing protein [Pectobacterium versatile]|uniref:HEPN/Toprim-associated domain-containing protein n=1 Tax=Pectobacterium versatile TaxID=2488639 RepID=UPI00102E5CFE|nr:HEPN/Toprim-associated domain-containing protein [Pectobacterium versatile]TAI82298.1 hypothetical protein EG330_14800 [Pectobacterium versatile]